jgi:transcriptional regulator with XRE-family HTH domain
MTDVIAGNSREIRLARRALAGEPSPADAADLPPDHSPTVRGRRLMRELKRLREQSGISPDEAARRLDFSKSKLYRIENGRSRIDADDLEDMLDLYDVRSPERDALIALGRESRRRGWWTRYKDVFTGSYVALESEAASIRVNSHLIPGFLQTAAYARAVIAANGPWLGASDTERRAVARSARRDSLLGRTDSPDIRIVLDESVLRREVGGPRAFRDQLRELVAAAELPFITLRVLPFAAGAAPGMEGEFVILTFPDPEDSPVAYVEGMFGDVYLESKEEVGRFEAAWDVLAGKALSPADSVALIREITKEES